MTDWNQRLMETINAVVVVAGKLDAQTQLPSQRFLLLSTSLHPWLQGVSSVFRRPSLTM